MKVELQNGDRITIPEGCKATINGNEVVIEKEQVFKDGDVLEVECSGHIIIFQERGHADLQNKNYYYVCMDAQRELKVAENHCQFYCGYTNNARHATDEEKQLRFNKMKEQGLRWNAEEKKVEKIRWRAEKGEYFYFVQADGCVLENTEISNEDDDKIHEYGNYFRTQEQAERAAEVVKEALEKFHEENEQMP